MTAVGGLALLASLPVAFTYPAGYPEFRNREVGLVLIGNGLITLAYYLSMNPIGYFNNVTSVQPALKDLAERVLGLPSASITQRKRG